MGEVIRIKQIAKENVEKSSMKNSKADDYNVVLRHFQGLMLDKYHQDYRQKK